MSPTQHSLRYCRERGWSVCIVERHVPFRHITIDAFGFGDLLAVDPLGHGAILIQTTTGANMSARRHKALDAPKSGTDYQRRAALIAWTTAGNRLLLHGWRKLMGKWQVREEEIKLVDLCEGQRERKKREREAALVTPDFFEDHAIMPRPF